MRVVFVHGALVRDGAWWWHRTAEVLAQQGFSSSSQLLPNCGETAAEPKAAAWQDIPSTYLVCTDDLGSPAPWQRRQAERADRVVQLPSGHHPFLSMPAAVAALVTA